ncbi:protein YgfX [Pseudomonas sp. StFLB209]|uniref:protein YgfX n=1 Tax=Pseudomonas sp. StFLB209 TaxID=1028989 RepID=UPI0005EDF6B5|nr:protein YgfX [Pseudomonas sp. StFLB209]
MSSRSKAFECRWQASRSLLTAYLVAQTLACLAVWLLDVPVLLTLFGWLVCAGHAAWVLPRAILLSHARAFRGVRHGRDGWQVWSEARGWQPVQIVADSLALPLIIVLRFRPRAGQGSGWLTRSVCIPRDALAPDTHRRLRVLLKFARYA